MKNNKGYYSWIHDLNRATMQSQIKGRAMLNETKATRITDPAKQAELTAAMQPPPPFRRDLSAVPEDKRKSEVYLPIYDESGKQIDARTYENLSDLFGAEVRDKIAGKVRGYEFPSEESVELADGAPEALTDINAQKYAEALALRAEIERSAKLPTKTDLKPVDFDVDGDGDTDADDVEEFAKDVQTHRETIPGGRLPTYPVAAEARAEHAKQTWKDQHRAERVEARTADEVAKYEADQADKHWTGPIGRTGETYYGESVSRKIGKFLHEGEESTSYDSEVERDVGQGGTNRPGDDEYYSRLDVPFEISRKMSSSEKIGKILHMVSNPEKYHPKDVRWAKEALATMQRAFQKD